MPLARLANQEGRAAVVLLEPAKTPKPPTLGLPDAPVFFARHIAATSATSLHKLQERFGEGLGAAIAAGDPEAEPEIAGRACGELSAVYLDPKTREPLAAEPFKADIATAPDGTEISRAPAADRPANIRDEAYPLRIRAKAAIAPQDAIRKYRFRRALQIRHLDGAGYEFLFAIARALSPGLLYFVGAGPGGRDPLVLAANGKPHNAFLLAKTQGASHMMLLFLADMELRLPQAEAAGQ